MSDLYLSRILDWGCFHLVKGICLIRAIIARITIMILAPDKIIHSHYLYSKILNHRINHYFVHHHHFNRNFAIANCVHYHLTDSDWHLDHLDYQVNVHDHLHDRVVHVQDFMWEQFLNFVVEPLFLVAYFFIWINQ